MKQFLVVLKYEFLTFTKSKVYIGFTVALVVIAALLLSFPSLFSLISGGIEPSEPSKPEEHPIIWVDTTQIGSEYATFLHQSLPDYVWVDQNITDISSVQSKIEAEEIHGALVFTDSLSFTLYVKGLSLYDMLPQEIETSVTQKYKHDQMLKGGFTQEEADTILSATATAETVELGKSASNNFLYTYILLILLYTSVLLYGQIVATSVAGEKSNRAMEMLITSAKPRNLMFGKVFGSGLAGLTQIGITLLSIFTFYQINRASWADNFIIQKIFDMPLNIVLITILFYLIGFFMFAFMYGAVGSLASRTEDVNTLISPLMLIFMAVFFIAIYGVMGDPNSPLIVISSFIPISAPMVMFVRISLTDVPIWQILVSVTFSIATIGFLGWLAAKIYRVGVLMYGKPPKIGELIKVLRSSRNQ